MGVYGDLARSSSVAVHRGGHLASGQQGGDLLLRGHELPRFGLLQRLADEVGVLFDLGARITLPHPVVSGIRSGLLLVPYLELDTVH